jgi:hypothetical protein
MNRMSQERAIVLWDVGTPAVRTIQPEGRIGTWLLSEDGAAITVQQDITKKTDYDVIGGREFQMITRPTAGGEPRTLFPTLRNTQVQWADDGLRYVYAREGRVFAGTIADTVRRQLLGPTMPARGAEPATPDTSAAARAQRAKERFAVTRWSPAGDAILASNSEGFWLVDIATGTKDMILALPDSTSMAPRPSRFPVPLPATPASNPKRSASACTCRSGLGRCGRGCGAAAALAAAASRRFQRNRH